MAISRLPSGTRGARTVPHVLTRLVQPLLIRVHRRSGDRFRDIDLLYLHTRGARTGQPRTAPVARFDDPGGGWVVVASAGGAAHHPAWYLNVVAHPDDVEVEVHGRRYPVHVEQLAGVERDDAWRRIVRRAPGFAVYESKTDRVIPVLRLRARGTV